MPSARPSAFTFTSIGPYRLYSTEELMALPPPDWLIDGIIPVGAFVTLYAPPESFKSFGAMDIAMCVASGVPWHGRKVKQGLAIYIAAEGVSGLGKRALAWLTEHDMPVGKPDIAWLTESLPVTADSDALIDLLEKVNNQIQRRPALIVIDTLARCFDGEESAPEDMNRFVAGVDVLRRAFDCAVMVVHHTRLDGTRERGGTGLRAASDTMLAMERAHGEVIISCAKQKDAEHFPDIALRLKVVEGTDSCVLIPSQSAANHENVLVELLQLHQPCSWEDWKLAAAQAGIDERAFASHTARKGIRARIEKVGGTWRVKA